MNVGSTDLLDFFLTNDFDSSDLIHLVTRITDNGSFNQNGQQQNGN